jgi:transposase InsO family protein
LAIEAIDHTKTKARSPQTNGICEGFHRTLQDEFYQVAFRKKWYTSLAELQANVDHWLVYYHREGTHRQTLWRRTPFQTFQATKQVAQQK